MSICIDKGGQGWLRWATGASLVRSLPVDAQIKAQIMSESKEGSSYLETGEVESVGVRRKSSEGTMVEEVGAVRLAMRV